jgi:outer membrane immunogenic protein
MLRIAALSALMISAGGMASAAGPVPIQSDPVIAQPVVVPDAFWSGGYLGVQLGYAYSDFDLNLRTRPGDFDDDSVIGGIHAGYLWQLGTNFLIGPEFQYDFAKFQVTDSVSGDTASFDSIARLKIVGGSEIGSGFLYGSAGIAYADFDNVGNVFDGVSGADTNFVLSIGYDYRIGENWSLGAEYMYHHFNDIGSNGGDVELNTLHVKATYRF